jgi:exonuclease SbcD
MGVRECLSCDDVNDHDSAMRALVARIAADRAANTAGRAILMAHAFVAGGSECESERPLSVGGAGQVGADALAGFDYVALGHLHAPQKLGPAEIRYSGSLLKYSFEEADHAKGVYLVDMDATGHCDVRQIRLPTQRDVRRIAGTIDDLLRGDKSDDYLEVTLTDDGPVLDAIGRLRAVYPNVMSIRRPERTPGTDHAGDRPDLRGKSELELFSAFFKHVTAQDLTDAQASAFAATVEDLHRRERESAEPAAPPRRAEVACVVADPAARKSKAQPPTGVPA